MALKLDSPQDTVNSPLGILASVVTKSPHEANETVENKVQYINLGTYKSNGRIHTLRMYFFKYGIYFELDQVAELTHSDNMKNLLNTLTGEIASYEILQNTDSMAIYLSQQAIEIISSEIHSDIGFALVDLNEEELQKGTGANILANVDGFLAMTSFEKYNTVLNVVPFVKESNIRNKRALVDQPVTQKGKNMRLSIETNFRDKSDNTPEKLEQLKTSYLVKQQQQAIIDARSRNFFSAASPKTETRERKKHLLRDSIGGIDQIVSPRAEFSSRELPRPRGYEGPVSHSAHPLTKPRQIPSPEAQTQFNSSVPELPSKAQFMSVFESLYNSLEQSSRLEAQLKEQLRKSSTILKTLTSSGSLVESLVRSHFREMQSQYGEKFGSALSDLNRRLVAIEQSTTGISHSDAFTASGALRSAYPKENGPFSAQIRSSVVREQEHESTPHN